MSEERIAILTVYSTPHGYSFDAPQGQSVEEMACVTALLGRTLVRDGYLKDISEFLAMVTRYATDSQYAEVEVTDADKDNTDTEQ